MDCVLKGVVGFCLGWLVGYLTIRRPGKADVVVSVTDNWGHTFVRRHKTVSDEGHVQEVWCSTSSGPFNKNEITVVVRSSPLPPRGRPGTRI